MKEKEMIEKIMETKNIIERNRLILELYERTGYKTPYEFWRVCISKYGLGSKIVILGIKSAKIRDPLPEDIKYIASQKSILRTQNMKRSERIASIRWDLSKSHVIASRKDGNWIKDHQKISDATLSDAENAVIALLEDDHNAENADIILPKKSF